MDVWMGLYVLGNDTKRMRNCNGLDVGLMSLVVRVSVYGGEKGEHR